MVNTHLTQDKVVWYLETCCSNHMICNKYWFIKLDKLMKRLIRFVDNNTITIDGI